MQRFFCNWKVTFGLAIIILMGGWSAFQSCSSPDNCAIIDSILNDETSFFYLDVRKYPQSDPTLPVGIFDSGTGGLTVLDAIVRFDEFDNQTGEVISGGDGVPDFQKEWFIYLGDQANMPYGNYAAEDNTELLREHILKDVQFLLGNKYYRSAESVTCENDKMPVKSIVIACNTATAMGKEFIESFIEKAGLDIRVIGVIGAGVRGAFQHIRENENSSIGIMATAGTVASGGYTHAIERHIQEHGYSGNIAVFQQAGIGLAGAIDGFSEYILPDGTVPDANYRGPAFRHSAAVIDRAIMARYDFDWNENRILYSGSRENPETIQLNSVENYIRYHIVSLLEQVRKSPRAIPLKVIILGCTHYPFYSAQIREQLQRLYHYQENGQPVYRSCMADTIMLIDPAENTARELYKYLRERQLVNDAGLDRSEFYISIPNRANPAVRLDTAGNFTYKYKYHRRVGDIQEYVRRIPFSRLTLDEQVIRRLQKRVPMVYHLICEFNRSNPKTRFLSPPERL